MKDLFGWTIAEDIKMAQFDRLANYDKQWCYQYEMRRSLREEDLRFSDLSEDYVKMANKRIHNEAIQLTLF